MSWSDGQVRAFAKRLADSPEGRGWSLLVPRVREAVISEFVLGIVFAQAKGEVLIEDVRSLRVRLCARLAEHHKMPTASDWSIA